MPKPQTYAKSTIPYSLTISPPERSYDYAKRKLLNPLRQVYHEDEITIRHCMMRMKCKNYIIYPELDDKGRLHYHGTLYMNKTLLTRFYKCSKPLLQRIGYVDCSPTKNILDWHIYTRKEWPITKSILELDTPITYCNWNQLPVDDAEYKALIELSLNF